MLILDISCDLVVTNNHFSTVNPFEQINENANSIIDQDRDESNDSFKTDDRSCKGMNQIL